MVDLRRQPRVARPQDVQLSLGLLDLLTLTEPRPRRQHAEPDDHDGRDHGEPEQHPRTASSPGAPDGGYLSGGIVGRVTGAGAAAATEPHPFAPRANAARPR